MKALQRKYAEFILKTCLKVDENSSLLIATTEKTIEFANLMKEEAIAIGLKDIYIHIDNIEKKRELLLTKNIEELEKLPEFDRSIWNEYAKKDAAFASINSPLPNYMEKVDKEKMAHMNKIVVESMQIFKEKQRATLLPWCIFAAPNKIWADILFPNDENSIETLWNKIFDICLINDKDTNLSWEKKLDGMQSVADKLNTMSIKTLRYLNSLGTDLTLELSKQALWTSAKEKKYIVNMPTEEIFTTPIYNKTNGVVYSSKPLIYSGVTMENFGFKFVDGKVTEVIADTNRDVLENMIKMDENASFLGECALVNYDSPISNSNIVFMTTLYDENASCHLALGSGFCNCYENGENMTKEELQNCGVNDSLQHVDFMVGTSDLTIIATTYSGEQIKIMENGNIII